VLSLSQEAWFGYKLSFNNVYGMRPFVALRNLEVNHLTFVQSLTAITLNRAVVNQYIPATGNFNECVTFRIFGPFHPSSVHK
jgi:hypothetical protein